MVNPKLKAIIRAMIDTAPINIKVAQPLDKSDYDGYTCPHCKRFGTADWEGRTKHIGCVILYPRICCECGATWDDKYEITGYTHLERPVEGDR